jgi:hypothetical protein
MAKKPTGAIKETIGRRLTGPSTPLDQEPIPERFLELLRQLEEHGKPSSHDAASAKDELAQSQPVVPQSARET